MILIDYSMICKSNFAIAAKSCTIEDKEYALQNGYVDLDDGRLCYESFRYAILNSLRKYITKFSREYGAIVLACDSKDAPYWRKVMNPHYKGNRKTFDSPMPWKLCLTWMDTLLQELDQNMPYNIISVPGAEADDIIGVLSRKYSV